MHLTAQANRLTTGYLSERLIHNRALSEYAQPPINPIHEVSAKADPAGTLAILQPLMSDQSTILIGQSGMGKSSLVNLLVPDAEIAVREISLRLDTGKHTTTFTRLYTLDEQSNVIDSPGFQ